MNSRLSLFLVVCLACLTLASQPILLADDPGKKASDKEIDKEVSQSLDTLRKEYEQAISSGDANRAAQLFAEDAILMRPDAPSLQGRQRIQESLADTLRQYDQKVSVKSQETKVAGDWIYDRGTVRVKVTPKAGTAQAGTFESKYLAIFARQDDGSWKLSHLIWNDDQPYEDMTRRAE